jgi:hypothetical protein
VVFFLAGTILIAECEEFPLGFIFIWFGKREIRESLITLAIQSLLFFTYCRFTSIIQDGCWCLYGGFYLWAILPVLVSFDLLGLLD